MPDLTELYQSIILDHNRRPRNFHEMEGADRRSEGHNPLCGDELTLWVRMDGDVIADVSFLGKGCAISKASASCMTVAVKGKTRAEAEALFARFHAMVTGTHGENETPAVESTASMGSLAAFAGVAQFPIRVKCASLAWHTLRSALADAGGTVTTE
ncbi:MAG TPA: SUF system NifU family Fe-S cluster assembly protein [Gemmatimonadaceae bacterium]|nr:SUF system NifU family Fe-S cluster assembly protein [Gemmatimonadaceae bacterium]